MSASVHIFPDLSLTLAVWHPRPAVLSGACQVNLPGTQRQSYRWTGGVTCPEEMASFYDDVAHTLRVEHSFILLALEDLTRVQVPLPFSPSLGI